MKKFIIITLLLSLFLSSCGGDAQKETAPVTPDETTAETVTDTTAAEKIADFDFENAEISSYKIVNAGDKFPLSDFASDGEIVSSRPSVAEAESGELSAKSDGVTLIGDLSAGKVTVLCVLPEGQMPEMIAGEPKLLEVGETAFVEGFGSADTYKSSAPDVASLEETTVTAKSPGYAVIDVSNVSMPKMFSFIVYDRVVE